MVLLHGFGSSASQWQPFAATIAPEERCRFVFPEGPMRAETPTGTTRGRAWWPLELDAHVPPGGAWPDFATATPPGLLVASEAVSRLVARTARATGRAPILGGFSQGAMVAAETAFASDAPLAALVLLSVTPVDERAWQAGFSRRRPMPVFLAHGRSDATLSFAAAERLRDEMRHAGLEVTWVAFEGGHEIPATVVSALNAFLEAHALVTPSERHRGAADVARR